MWRASVAGHDGRSRTASACWRRLCGRGALRGWLVLTLMAALAGCTEERTLSRQPEFVLNVGSDFTSAGVLGADGSLLLTVNSAGVGITERQDVDTGRIVRGAQGTSLASSLISVSVGGKLLWSLGFPSGVGAPVVASDGTIFVSTAGVLHAISPKGKELWIRAVSGAQLSLCGDDTVLVAGASGITAISADGSTMGPLLRTEKLQGRGAMLPVICTGDGQLLTVTDVDPSLNKPSERWLTALDLSGELLWHVPLPAGALPSALLRDDAGQVLVAYGQPRRTEVYGADGTLLRTLDGFSVTALTPTMLVGVGDATDATGATGAPAGTAPADNAVMGLGPDGSKRWAVPVGRSYSAPIVTSDGAVHFAEDTRKNDLGSGSTVVNTLRSDGTRAHQYRVAMNAFSGPLVVAKDGTLLATGMWVNQYPPFQALVAGMWSHSTKLAPGGWPRLGRDNRGSSFAGPVVKGIPTLPQLRGTWLADTAPWRALQIGAPDAAWTELDPAATSYAVWSASAIGSATLVERGTLALAAGSVQLQPTWRADGGALAASTRTLRSGDPWRLQLDDPLVAGSARSFRRVYGLPAPPSPFAGAGRVLWHSEFGGRVDEMPTTLAAGAKPGQVWMAGHYSGEGLAFVDPASAGTQLPWTQSAFYAVLDILDLDHAWSSYDVAKTGPVGLPLRIHADGKGGAVALAVPSGNATPDLPQAVFGLHRFDAAGKPTQQAAFAGSPGFPGSAVDMVVHNDGGTTVVGAVEQAATIAGQAVGEAGGLRRIWLARTDANDALQSLQTLANDGASQRPQQAALDSKGQLWIAGTSVAPQGPSAQTGEALALWKLDPAGKLLWTKSYGGKVDTGTLRTRLTIGPADEVAIFGSFFGKLAMASASLQTSDEVSDADGYVARIQGDGGVLWLRGFAAPAAQDVTAAAFDSHGVLHVGGVLGVELGHGKGKTAVLTQPVYAALSPCGELLWTREAESCPSCPYNWLLPAAMVRQSDDSIFAVASIAGRVRLGGVKLASFQLGDAAKTPSDIALHQLSAIDAPGLKVLAALPGCSALPSLPHHVGVELVGDGGGRVVSSPAGIDCPGTCSASFPTAQVVTLTATAAANASFLGWSGSCSGLAACTVQAGADATLQARFERPAVEAFETVGGDVGDEAIAMLAPDAGGATFLAQIATGAMGTGAVDFGGGPIAGLGGVDALVGRRGLDGATAWTVVVGGPGIDRGAGLSADGAGGAIVGAVIAGVQAQVGALGVTRDGDADVLLARLDATGKPLWAKFLGVDSGSKDTRLVGNGKGAVVVLGRVAAATKLHGVEVQGPYAMMVDAEGAVAWVRALPPVQSLSADVGPQGLTALAYRRSDQAQVELVMIDAQGKDVWTVTTKAFPGPSALSVGADGSLVALGMAGGASDFAPTLNSVPTWARFSAQGALLAVSALATAPMEGGMSLQSMAPCGAGVCYLTANGTKAIALGPDGAVLWSLALPVAEAIAAVPGGTLWLAGGLTGSAQVGGLSVEVAQSHHRDAWLARVVP